MTTDEALENVYEERNLTVIALARYIRSTGGDAFLAYNKSSTEQWPVLYILLPTGQVSWHLPAYIAKEHLADFPWADPEAESLWDGHDTDEKYRRLMRWAQSQ